jgi:hypothetical protein
MEIDKAQVEVAVVPVVDTVFICRFTPVEFQNLVELLNGKPDVDTDLLKIAINARVSLIAPEIII